MKVHLKGTFAVTRAAWNIMREKNYGRIINTGSSSGLYGSFGQVNYSTAKMGMHGFTQSLAKEGEKRNIKVNTICPLAGTRMTETVMPKEVLEVLKPDFVAPFVAYLCHDTCAESGSLFEVGAGYIAKQRWQRSDGVLFDTKTLTPEAVGAAWEKIVDFSQNTTNPTSNEEMMARIMSGVTNSPTPTPAPKKVEAAPVTASSSGSLKSDEIFGMMASYLAKGEGKALIPKVAAIFGFEITKTKGGKIEAIYEIDLKNGQGSTKKGKPASADATFLMTDADFE